MTAPPSPSNPTDPAEHLTEHRLASETLFTGRFLQARRDTVRLPDGSEAVREYFLLGSSELSQSAGPWFERNSRAACYQASAERMAASKCCWQKARASSIAAPTCRRFCISARGRAGRIA